MRTRQARQPASKSHDDSASNAAAAGAGASLDLAALPSVTLSIDMITHLLQNIQEGDSSTAQEAGLASSSSSSTPAARRTARKKPAKASDKASSATAAAAVPLREQERSRVAHNIHPSTTKQDSRENADSSADDATSLDADGREGAAGVTRRTCSHCGRLFKRASDCRRHERIHTNDKWVEACSILYDDVT